MNTYDKIKRSNSNQQLLLHIDFWLLTFVTFPLLCEANVVAIFDATLFAYSARVDIKIACNELRMRTIKIDV